MKIKPLYLYGTVFIIAAAIIFFVVQQDNTVNIPTSSDITNQAIPQDSIHRGLTNPVEQPPSSSNVSPSVTHQMEMLEKAVEENPRDTLKMRQYADFLGAAHQKDKAIEYYNKILKIDPKRTDILFSLSYVYYLSHDLNNAENVMNKVLKIDKNNSQAYYNLGAIAATRGDKEKAKSIWKKLISDSPNSPIAKLAESSLNRL